MALARPRHAARRLAWLLFALSLPQAYPAPTLAIAQGNRPVVHVFLQLDAKPSVVEKALQEHLPDLTVTVYGRYRDFEEGTTSGHPDAVFTIKPVLDQRARSASLQGLRGGKNSEPYVLASVNQALEGKLAGKTIGVVDLLGRDGTQAFVSGLLKTTEVKIKRVAKVEDLLPLLEFSAADAIVLPGSMLARLLERTRLVIKARELPDASVGLPALAVLSPALRDVVVNSFRKLDAPTKRLLGIESWSVP